MDLKTIHATLEELAEEKGISKEKVLETIEMALAAAYKRDYGKRGQIVRASFDPKSGGITFRRIFIVVDESMLKSEAEEGEEEVKDPQEVDGEVQKVRFNPERHIMIEEAQKNHPDVTPGDEIEEKLETRADYGRIAAQTAKQVIIQRIREAERESVFEDLKEKEGGVVSGIVQRVENGNVFLDIGRTVALLPVEEQVQHERYRIGERVKGLLLISEKNPRRPSIIISRSHPKFVLKLFEIEVPEISQELVEIKSIAREPGSRSKIAAVSYDENIDPVGSLVGQKGVRVGTVIAELGGEKIDIIEWSENPADFIASALSPAKVIDIETNEEEKSARVLVDEEQLSLAIGRNGQNVRLAARLTGWKIDIATREGDVANSDEEEEELEDVYEESEPETSSEEAESAPETPEESEEKTEKE